MLKKSCSLLFALFVLSLAFLHPSQEVSAVSLTDIPDRSKDEINYLIDKEIIFGYTDGTFKPKNSVSRKEAAAMIGRALHLENDKQETTFPDVSSEMYASGYIASATEKGIITGHTDGTFKPNDSVTRAQMAIIISRAFSLVESGSGSFSDVAKNSYYYDSIDLIASAGISVGYPDGTFKPDNQLTREEFSILMAKTLRSEYGHVVQEPSEDEPTDEGEVDPTEGEDSSKEEGSEEPLQVIAEKVVNVDSLNVRKGPGTENDVVGQFNAGDSVDVHEYEGDWALVSAEGKTGYVHTYYLIDKSSGVMPKTIAIDPGHGGSDPGAVSNGLVEKEVVLDVSLKIREYLKGTGINVVMTRKTDWYPSLDGRVKLAQDGKADAFVSVHANAFMKSANGVETFYYASGMTEREKQSLKLATFINDRLHKSMDMNNRGVKNAGYRVIKATTLPAALTEIGFLTNDEDAKKLKTQHYRKQAAKAIADGIEDYYNWRY